MFLLPIKLDRVTFKTKGRQNLQKTADFLTNFNILVSIGGNWVGIRQQ